MKKKTISIIGGTALALSTFGYGVLRHVGLEDVFASPWMWVKNSVNMVRDISSDSYDKHVDELVERHVQKKGDKLVITLHGGFQTNQSTFSDLEQYLNMQEGLLCANLDWDYRESVSSQRDSLGSRIREISEKTGISLNDTYIVGHSLGAIMAVYLLDQNSDLGGVLALGGAFYGLTEKDLNLVGVVNETSKFLKLGVEIKEEALQELEDPDFQDMLSGIPRDKVIFVYGDDDPSAPVETSVIPGGRYVVLEGEAHLGEAANSDHFPRYVRMIKGFGDFEAPIR